MVESLLHGKYHERFKDWKVGQAWLIKKNSGFFLNVVFSKDVEIGKPIDVVGVDVNENNVTIAKPNDFERRVTGRKILGLHIFLSVGKFSRKLKLGRKGESCCLSMVEGKQKEFWMFTIRLRISWSRKH